MKTLALLILSGLAIPAFAQYDYDAGWLQAYTPMAGGGSAGSADVITVITNSDHYASIYTSPTLVGSTDSRFTYYGFPTNDEFGATYAAGISSAAELDKKPPVVTWFTFTGTNCEVILFPFGTGTYAFTPPYFTIMEGTNVTAYTNMPPFVQNNNNPFYVQLTFSQNTTHVLKLALNGGFMGIDFTNGSLASFTPSLKPNVWMDVGDSYVEQYNPNITLDGDAVYWHGWLYDIWTLETNNVIIPSGVSGTGFYATNSGTDGLGDLPYTWRMTNDVWGVYSNLVSSGLYNHIYISFNGSVNDFVQVGDNPSITNIIFGIATNCLYQTKVHCPLATVFLIGNWLGVGGESSPSAADYELEWAMTNAAAVANVTCFDPIPANLKNAGNLYTAWYPSPTDNVHPAAAGYWIMANWAESNLDATYGSNWKQ